MYRSTPAHPLTTEARKIELALTGGYGHEALQAAFDLVKNPVHWKEAIDATIPASEAGAVVEAIVYFTGSRVELYPSRDGKTFRVIAPGYYSAIGA